MFNIGFVEKLVWKKKYSLIWRKSNRVNRRRSKWYVNGTIKQYEVNFLFNS